jgi:catechol 2,3-dioxygenase-like lactoylglutathione lyase family enzyme
MPSHFLDETKLHVKRPCLIVADLERSLTLYRDLLGFRLDYASEASPDSYLYAAFGFPQHAQLKFAALSTDCEPRSLALTEAKNIDLPPPSLPHRAATVIRVPEVAPLIAKIGQLELKIVRASSFTAPPNLRFTEQAFCDWDGHLIVLYDVREDEAI